MATNTDLTTITDDEARMRAFQIVGSDLGADAVFNGNWHDALKTFSAACAAEPTPQPAA